MMRLPNGCMSRRMHVAMQNTARACSISIIAAGRSKARGFCTRSRNARGACMMRRYRWRRPGWRMVRCEASRWVERERPACACAEASRSPTAKHGAPASVKAPTRADRGAWGSSKR
ncbi:hypothetical protein F7R21_02660 [Burkholderia latens]|uniref:Uncharacterized protein n=1 Tax=Burkholderia latens TaxID=488446 RepID=A0A6H9T0Q4_9BURK|nr:hypothetical protein F7R21_02660 [Burkholderia latens]